MDDVVIQQIDAALHHLQADGALSRDKLAKALRSAKERFSKLEAALVVEGKLRVQLSDDSQKHLDRALLAEAKLAEQLAATDAQHKRAERWKARYERRRKP